MSERIIIGGKSLNELARVERFVLITRTPGQRFLGGIINAESGKTVYLTVPKEMRTKLDEYGLSFEKYKNEVGKVEVSATCDALGRIIRLEYTFEMKENVRR